MTLANIGYNIRIYSTLDKKEKVMVRALVLYILSVRPTHGYDIQRFIEINGMDQWAKIKSGSIYYALSKLEEQGFIFTLREERTGARVRKVYAINGSGIEELKRILRKEILKPIDSVESEKFTIYLMFNRLKKEEIIGLIEKHIKTLEERKKWWEDSKKLKVMKDTLKVEILHFDAVICNLEYQISWHRMLIEELDDIIIFSNGIEKLISKVDFGELEDVEFNSKDKTVKDVTKLTEEIIKNPTNLEEKITTLISLLKNK
ncbi:hypothetical protein CLFE_034740 [Clostridium felsineum DSM 794]|nr:hypothetical protein CLFE_034740 [Clostridium felsineum DSM 794]